MSLSTYAFLSVAQHPVCEKNESASLAGPDDQAKSYATKTSAFAFSLDGDKTTKTL
jgi:hypothetical protein